MEVVESTAKDGWSPSEEGGSTLQATTAEASKKRKVDNSAADNVRSSSSETARVRKIIDRLVDFAKHLDDSDDEEKDDEDEDEGENGMKDERRIQPLTPSRSLELLIITHLKKGRQIKSVSPLGDPHPDPNFP